MKAGPRVFGPVVDDKTWCIHYRTDLDVVAIQFACCGRFYPCHLCHAETAEHRAEVWPVSAGGVHAILCGVCRTTLSISDYLATENCPCCAAPFNPGCSQHATLYFAR